MTIAVYFDVKQQQQQKKWLYYGEMPLKIQTMQARKYADRIANSESRYQLEQSDLGLRCLLWRNCFKN